MRKSRQTKLPIKISRIGNPFENEEKEVKKGDKKEEINRDIIAENLDIIKEDEKGKEDIKEDEKEKEDIKEDEKGKKGIYS